MGVLRAFAHLADRRPWRVLLVTIAAAVVAGAYGGSVADQLGPYDADDPASEHIRTEERLVAATSEIPEEGLLVQIDIPTRADRGRIRQVENVLRRDPGVANVNVLVAPNGKRAYASSNFRSTVDEDEQVNKLVAQISERFPGARFGGRTLGEQQVNETVESDLRRAELIAFPLLLLLSFVFFRSLVAAALPLLVGVISIVLTMAAIRFADGFTEISIFALNLVTGLGLGLAIDYSLFMVSRFREETARGAGRREALERTLATAGRTVLFSALTVAAAMASLVVFPAGFLYSMGIGGAVVALVAAGVALVVLPAVLALLGPRVNSLAPKRLQRAALRDARPAQQGAWYRLSRFVARRPLPIAAAATLTMLALGLPFTGIKFHSVDVRTLPASSEVRQVDKDLREDFANPPNSPVNVIAEAPANAAVRDLADRIARVPGVSSVARPKQLPESAGRASLISVSLRARAIDDESQEAVRRIRALPAPFEFGASGETAAFIDQKASIADHIPLGLAIIAATTILVLFLMTGSVVLPLKALLMNVLTVSAAFGLLVLIFQHGRLEGLLDYESQGGLEFSQPVVLFAVAFGLSTDYGVFLLSRIKEARDGGAEDSEAVAVGLERTGRIVTSAAVLFCVAIGAFATSEIIFIKQVGVGTALAVLIDATIVRGLLVPALMELLGRRNWWAPGPLRRLHRRLGLAEH